MDIGENEKSGIYMNTGKIDTGSSDAILYVGGSDYSSIYTPSTDSP
jgi:hypothetical protein